LRRDKPNDFNKETQDMSIGKSHHWMAASMILIAMCLPGFTLAADLTSPQPEHALLEQFSGNWTFERWTTPADGTEAQLVGNGEVRAEMIGRFFVKSRWSGKIMGFDFDAVQLLGYDANRQDYSGTWGDSFMSFRWELTGSLDEDSDELILQSSGPSPTGFEGTFRERYQFESAESITIIAEVQQDEGWQKMMKTHLTRTD
jgi:hypothetical protein